MSVPEMDDVVGHAYRRIRGCCFFFHLGSAGTNSEASAKKASAKCGDGNPPVERDSGRRDSGRRDAETRGMCKRVRT
jgi:hypothetical protein